MNTDEATIDLTTSNPCFDNFTYTDPEPDTGASTDIASYIVSKVAEMGDSMTLDSTVTKETSGDWDYTIQFSGEAPNEEGGTDTFSMNLKLKNSSNITAASLADENEIWSISVDQGNGVMSF